MFRSTLKKIHRGIDDKYAQRRASVEKASRIQTGPWGKLKRDRSFGPMISALEDQELQRIDQEQQLEVRGLDDEKRALATNELLEEAARRMVPAPPVDDTEPHWINTLDGDYVLTEEGMSKLKADLAADRDYRLGRYDPAFRWGGLVMGTAGVVIAIIALVASIIW